MSEGRRKVPRWVWVLVKLAVAAGIVAWMVYDKAIRPEDVRRAREGWPWLLAALAVLLVGMFLQSVRWCILIRAQGIRIRLVEAYTLTMTGQFFSLVAPGGIGGDGVKAYYVARGREQKAAAVTTVFLDRYLGFVTLFLVAGVMVLLDIGRLWHAKIEGLNRFGLPGGRLLALLIGAGAAGLIAFGLVMTSKRVRRSALLARLSRFVPFRPTVAKVYEAVHLYGDRRWALCGAALVSVVAQIPLYLVYYLYGQALGAGVELWHCALIVPPAMVVRVLPVLPGGAGQGMAAMRFLFPLVGVALGGAVGGLGDAVFIATYLIGGAFFVFGKSRYRDMRPPLPAGPPGPSPA